MAVELRHERGDAVSVTASALRALADAGSAAVASGSSSTALAAFARAAVEACAADVSVVRALDADGEHLTARAVYSASPSLAALLEGSRIPAAELGGVESPRAPHFGAADSNSQIGIGKTAHGEGKRLDRSDHPRTDRKKARQEDDQ